MSKVFTFVSIFVGVFALMSIFGVANSSTSQMLRALSFDNPQNLKSFDFFALLYSPAGIVAILGILGGIAATFIRGQPWFFMVISGFIGALAGWMVGDMYSIYMASTQALSLFPWMGQGLKVVFFVWIAGFIVALVAYWGGSDG